LLAKVCRANPGASVADLTQSTKRRRVAWLLSHSVHRGPYIFGEWNATWNGGLY
jgi:hypothetical protein